MRAERTALRELLECLDDYDLVHCSFGDHAHHDVTDRGMRAIMAGWAALRAPNALLEAAQQVLNNGGQDQFLELANAVADATGEDEPA